MKNMQKICADAFHPEMHHVYGQAHGTLSKSNSNPNVLPLYAY
jgi:hypothetical protein